jgi:hypothetical protein
MRMLGATQDVLNSALNLTKEYGMDHKRAMNEAFSNEIGFGSTDLLSIEVLEELHALGLMLHHKINR